jgi:hypothetical protein
MKASKNESTMSTPERIAILETTILNINSTLLDLRQDMKRGFDKIDNKFDNVDNKLDALQDRLWSNFLWLMGMIIGLAGLIAHIQHWI